MQAANDTNPNVQPGVEKNPHGGYHIRIKLNERQASQIIGGVVNLDELAPPGTPTLSEMEVFEDCVLFNRFGYSLQACVIRVPFFVSYRKLLHKM